MKEKYESLEELLEDYTHGQVIEFINSYTDYMLYILELNELKRLAKEDPTIEEILKVVDSYSFGRKK